VVLVGTLAARPPRGRIDWNRCALVNPQLEAEVGPSEMSTVIAVTPDLLEQWLCRLRSGVELTHDEQMAAVVFGLGRDREFRLHLTRLADHVVPASPDRDR
jgi:hypothetical protein